MNLKYLSTVYNKYKIVLVLFYNEREIYNLNQIKLTQLKKKMKLDSGYSTFLMTQILNNICF